MLGTTWYILIDEQQVSPIQRTESYLYIYNNQYQFYLVSYTELGKITSAYYTHQYILFSKMLIYSPSSSVLTVMGSLNGPIPTTVAAAILTV